jgi:hypothetical protein
MNNEQFKKEDIAVCTMDGGKTWSIELNGNPDIVFVYVVVNGRSVNISRNKEFHLSKQAKEYVGEIIKDFRTRARFRKNLVPVKTNVNYKVA